MRHPRLRERVLQRPSHHGRQRGEGAQGGADASTAHLPELEQGRGRRASRRQISSFPSLVPRSSSSEATATTWTGCAITSTTSARWTKSASPASAGTPVSVAPAPGHPGTCWLGSSWVRHARGSGYGQKPQNSPGSRAHAGMPSGAPSPRSTPPSLAATPLASHPPQAPSRYRTAGS